MSHEAAFPDKRGTAFRSLHTQRPDLKRATHFSTMIIAYHVRIRTWSSSAKVALDAFKRIFSATDWSTTSCV